MVGMCEGSSRGFDFNKIREEMVCMIYYAGRDFRC